MVRDSVKRPSDGTTVDIQVQEAEQADIDLRAKRVTEISSLVPGTYDYIDVDYTDGNPTTIVYKTGGSGGTTVATLTITYTADGCVDTISTA